MSFKQWSPEGLLRLKSLFVELPKLDWHEQEMMLELGDEPMELILDVFRMRAQHERGQGENKYEAIPYQFNPQLQKYLAEQASYVDEIVKWLRDMTPTWSSYNWNVSHFIQRVGGASYRTILMKLVEHGDATSLAQAADALNAFEGADFDLCMEIVKRTDDTKTLGQVRSAMSGTGVVRGENGLGLAYEAKANALQPYVESENPRISSFAKDLKASFEDRARGERERSMIGKKQRRIEFEDGL